MRMRTLATVAATAAIGLATVAGPAAADHTKGKKYLDLDLTREAAAAADDGFGVAPEGTSGTGNMYINAGQERFCFFSDIETPEDVTFDAIHLHEKDADSDNPLTGPVVINLTGLIVDSDEDGQTDGTRGCVTADKKLLRDVLREPSDYYINAHFEGIGPVIRANFDHNGNA